MSKTTKQLSLFTVILFFASIFVYVQEHKRGTELTAGSDFIMGFDVDKVSKFILKSDNEKELIFLQENNKFVLQSHSSFPTSTDKVNELLFKIASLQISEKISSSKDTRKSLQVAKDNFKNHFQFFDKEGKLTLEFFIGDTKKTQGNYLRFADQDDIFLSNSTVYIAGDRDSYINKEIVKIDKDKIVHISNTWPKKKFNITKKDKIFEVENLKKSNVDAEKVNNYFRSFSFLNFNNFYTPGDQEVVALKFNQKTEVKLSNKIVYLMEFAKKNKKYYLKTSSLIKNAQNKFMISKDGGKEQLAGIEDAIKSQTITQKFNLTHSKWIYEISEYDYNKFNKKLSDFKKNL